MDIEQASYFLTSSILVMLGLVVIVIGVTAINNVIHRYWKPVKIFTPDSWKGVQSAHALYRVRFRASVKGQEVTDQIRGVSQSGQTACFGSRRPQVRILPPRPYKKSTEYKEVAD